MLADDLAVLLEYDAVRIGLDIDRTAALAITEYLLLSKRTRHVFDTDAEIER